MENSTIGRSCSTAKLFIMQKYTDNANVTLTVENVNRYFIKNTFILRLYVNQMH